MLRLHHHGIASASSPATTANTTTTTTTADHMMIDHHRAATTSHRRRRWSLWRLRLKWCLLLLWLLQHVRCRLLRVVHVLGHVGTVSAQIHVDSLIIINKFSRCSCCRRRRRWFLFFLSTLDDDRFLFYDDFPSNHLFLSSCCFVQ